MFKLSFTFFNVAILIFSAYTKCVLLFFIPLGVGLPLPFPALWRHRIHYTTSPTDEVTDARVGMPCLYLSSRHNPAVYVDLGRDEWLVEIRLSVYNATYGMLHK